MSPRTPMRGRNDTEAGIYKVDKWGQTYNIHYSRRSSGLAETAIVSDQSEALLDNCSRSCKQTMKSFVLTNIACLLDMEGKLLKMYVLL